MPQTSSMQGRGDSRKEDGSLASAAAPLSQALTAFFRRRAGPGADVDDLVQEVFARIAARDSSAPVNNLGGYVFATAASVLADGRRRQRVRHTGEHVPFDPERHSEEDFDPERILSGRAELRAATAALLSLPERTRTIFILARLEGYKYRDIAAQLGISVSAVEKQMVKAVQHLSRRMGTKRDT